MIQRLVEIEHFKRPGQTMAVPTFQNTRTNNAECRHTNDAEMAHPGWCENNVALWGSSYTTWVAVVQQLVEHRVVLAQTTVPAQF